MILTFSSPIYQTGTIDKSVNIAVQKHNIVEIPSLTCKKLVMI